MGATRARPYFTVDQYLAIERKSEERHFFLDGEIYLMAGESLSHGRISISISSELRNQLKGKPCDTLSKDTKVRSGPEPTESSRTKGLFSYPDIVVVCGEPRFHDEYNDVITNPTVVIEVLSPESEKFDRGEKFQRYQTWNPTLTDYLLVSQDRPQIEHFVREEDDGWKYKRYTGLETSVAIESIECTLQLADVYERVSFDDETSETI